MTSCRRRCRDTEALAGVIDELVAGVRGERQPRTDGAAGLRVLQILEASDRSLACGGVNVDVSLSYDATDKELVK